MTKSTFCWVVAGLTVVCLPSWAMAGAEADYKALFGEDEEKVSASNDSKEAAEFATRLVHAARAVGDQKDLQILLCTKAYEFAMKDPSGYQTAIEAMKLEMEVVPDKKGQAQEKLLEALLRRFALSTGAERKRLAEEIVDQLVARGDERASAKRPREAIDLYRKALDVAADSVSGRTGAIMDRIKAASTGLEAEGRLAALKKALKEDPKSTTARTALILAYLGEFDRPVEAVTLLTDDLDETLRTYVPLSAKPVADLGESACLELASWYAGIAGQASSPGKRVLLSKTKACCQRYLGLHATKDAARLKATMLLEKVTKEEEVAGAQHSKVVTVDLANGVRKGGVGNTSDEPRWAIRDSSDGAVQAAIEKAAAFLWTLQQPDGSWHLWKAAGMEDGFKDYIDGPTALVAYALMESGVTPSDKRMERALAWLEKVNARNANGTYVTKGYIPKTYCMGLRCQAWSAAIRQKGDYRRALQKDARQLMLSTSDGSYGYDSTGRPAAGDHSNSQYGTLGVAEAAMAGVDIPAAYWRKVTGHWEASQCNDGGWEYGGKAAVGKPTMAAAGVATLFVCFDNLYGEAFAGCTPSKEGRNARIPIQRGLDWFDQKYAGTVGAVDSYYLYGVERIGLASGYKYFGTTDWYKEGVKLLLKNQAANGSWKSSSFGDGAVATAQCMLFLIRGGRPVVFNKLKYEGDWNNRPRDLAMLTRWMGGTVFKQELSWQIVPVTVSPKGWHDAPILLITGSKAPTFDKDDLDNLRTYVGQGGTIFSVTECNGDGFDKGIRETYAKLFPTFDVKEAPVTHDLYRIQEDLTRSDLKFYVVSNGARPLAIHVQRDLTRTWQTYQVSAGKWAFQAALNVYLYVTNAGTSPSPASAPSKALPPAPPAHN